MAYILILDDEPDSCNLLKRIGDGLGHHTAAFTDEDMAIDHATTNHVDLVILDLRLKRLNGVQVFERLRDVHPEIQGLILTGYPTPESAQKASDLGIRDYLIKPVDVDTLEKTIADATRSQHCRRCENQLEACIPELGVNSSLSKTG